MRVAEPSRLALDQDFARVRTAVAAQALEQVRLALGLECDDAQYLAPAESERHILQKAGAKLANLDRGAWVNLPSWSAVGHRSFGHDHGCGGWTEHERHDLLLAARGKVDDADRGAVAQDRSAIAKGLHLCHTVRDQHHRATLGPPSPRHSKHTLAEVSWEGGRDLVEDEHARQRRQRLGEVEEMEGRRGEVPCVLAQVDVFQLELLEPGPDGGHRRPGQAEVLGDRQQRYEAHILVDRRQAGPARACRRAEPGFAAVEQDHPGVRGDVSGEDFDEGALAGPVRAHEGVDLAGPDPDVSRAERHHRPVVLRNAPGFEKDPVFGHGFRSDDRKRKGRAWFSPRPARFQFDRSRRPRTRAAAPWYRWSKGRPGRRRCSKRPAWSRSGSAARRGRRCSGCPRSPGRG